MDLLRFLTKTRDIQVLLSQYQESLWPRVIRAVLLYGYHSLRTQSAVALPIEVLEDKVRRSGHYVQVEDLLPNLKKQLEQVKSEILTLNTTLETEKEAKTIVETKTEPSPKQTMEAQTRKGGAETGDDTYRRAFPSSKPPGRSTLIFRDSSPPALRSGSNYNVVMRPNDIWGPQWQGDDYTKEIYPNWWLDMGKMDMKEKLTEKVTETAAPVMRPEDYVSFKPQPRRMPPPRQPSISQQSDDPSVELTPEREEIEVEDEAVQMPSLQSSQPRASSPRQGRPARSNTRANYSGWIGDFSDLVKRSPTLVHGSSEGSNFPETSPEEMLHSDSSRPVSYNPKIEAQIAQKAFEISGSSKSSAPLRRFEASSGSSMSTYRPTDEMKRFYRAEYSKFAQSGGTWGSTVHTSK